MRDVPTGQIAIETFAEGEEIVRKANEWIENNRETWAWMLYKANEYGVTKQRFSIDALAEEARWTKPIKGVDEYKVNNTIRAVLARKMMRIHPHCAPYIEIRSSKVDGLV